MARRVLSFGERRLAALALAVFLLAACKRRQAAPSTGSSATGVDSAAETAREARYQSELSRAQALWRDSPKLGKCAELMKEDGDRRLCADAEEGLAAVAALPPGAPPGVALPALGDAALALVRLFERARYLSLEELGRERLEGDAGAKARPAHSASAAPPIGSAPRLALLARSHEHKSLKLVESPVGQLAQNTSRLERDVLRELGAYLEYGPLSVRQAAYERFKALQTQHPQWPALHRVLREASVLETEPELKARLSASTGLASKPDQPAASK